ncbi:MAG: alpha/beta hydrolase [Woeseiaceae bacterium]
MTAAYFALLDPEKVNIPQSRSRLTLLGSLVPTARRVDVEKTNICGLGAEWLRPEKSNKNKVLLYLHGGAYVLGGCASHRHLVSHLARAGEIPALVPEYRLAPEHPFPAGVEDAIATYKELLSNGYAPGDIIVAGDSAGGGLTVAMLLALRDEGVAMPAAAVLMSPWLDLSGSGESMRTRDDADPWFNASDIPVVARFYCGNDEVDNPLVSPVYGDMSGMPPMHIQVGDEEILLSDATRLADKVRAAGGTADIDVWPGMWHVFQAFLLVMPESRDAIKKLGAYIKSISG